MKSTILYITLIIIAIVGFSSIYIVVEKEQVIVLQFGKPITNSITDAGLYFKIPVIQVVERMDKRILEWDGNAKQIPTKDNKYILGNEFQLVDIAIFPFIRQCANVNLKWFQNNFIFFVFQNFRILIKDL